MSIQKLMGHQHKFGWCVAEKEAAGAVVQDMMARFKPLQSADESDVDAVPLANAALAAENKR